MLRWMAVVLLLSGAQLQDQDRLYVIDDANHRIFSIGMDGGEARGVLASPNRPSAMTVTGGYVYWFDMGTNSIRSVGMDGSGGSVVVANALEIPVQHPSQQGQPMAELTLFAIDPDRDQAVWLNPFDHNLGAARLSDGAPMDPIRPERLGDISGFTVGPGNGDIFWASSMHLSSARFDGSGSDRIAIAMMEGAGGPIIQFPELLTVDSEGGFLYWTSSLDAGRETGIFRVPIGSGTGVEVEMAARTRGKITGMVIDGRDEFAYFITGGAEGELLRLAFDGSEPVLLAEAPHAIATARDTESGAIFWLQREAGQDHGVIRRLHGDGPPEITLRSFDTETLAVDSEADILYMAGSRFGGIRAFGMDGVFSHEVGGGTFGRRIAALTLHPGENNFYLIGNYSSPGDILRLDKDGGGLEVVQASPRTSQATALTLDPDDGKLYYMNSNQGIRERSTDVGETGSTPIVRRRGTQPFEGQTALDAKNQHLYYTNMEQGIVGRVLLSDMTEEILIEGLNKPFGIALSSAEGTIFWSDDDGLHRADLDGTSSRKLRDDTGSRARLLMVTR